MSDSISRRLIEIAIGSQQLAYAPYSKFRVGAALLTRDGTVFLGCNVENASYGLSVCAERTAICSAVAAGHQDFVTLVVAAYPRATPCGACRQFLVEFGADITVVSVNSEDPADTQTWKSGELLPESFTFKDE